MRVSRHTLDRWIRDWRRGGFDALVPSPRQVTPRTPAEVLELAAALKTGGPGPHRRADHRDPARPRRVGAARPHRAAPFRPAGPDHPARRRGRRRRSAGSKPPRSTSCGPATPCTARTWAGAKRSCSPSSTITAGRSWATGGRTGRTPSGSRPPCGPGWPPAASRSASTSTTAAAFVSSQLLRACAMLGIRLIHSRPGRPQGRGKIERVFRTVREQFLVELGVRPRAGRPRRAEPAVHRLGRDRLPPPGALRDRADARWPGSPPRTADAAHPGRAARGVPVVARPAPSPRPRPSACTATSTRSTPRWSAAGSSSSSTRSTWPPSTSRSAARARPWGPACRTASAGTSTRTPPRRPAAGAGPPGSTTSPSSSRHTAELARRIDYAAH